MRIAVIGTGISGNLVARLLANRHEVDVFEANNHIGGHAHSVEFEAFGRRWLADIGFMVFNDRTYPNFCRLLEILGIAAQPSDMSFSVSCLRTGLEYQGSSLSGLFAQRSNLIRPRFWQMLGDIVRFHRAAVQALESGGVDDGSSVGDFLERRRFGTAFREHYLLPMTAAIWSSRPATILEFPAKFLFGFMRNHGLLQLRDRPVWKTVRGGSRAYVEQLVTPFRHRIRLSCAVQSVTRHRDFIELETAAGTHHCYDHVVFAIHADQALRLLSDATRQERNILSAFPYQQNEAVLHTDMALLPRRRRAWASWNYHLGTVAGEPATLTYDVSRLQRLATPQPVLLTLNQVETVDRGKIIERFTFHHPMYNASSIAAQSRFTEINGVQRTSYCGAYWGFGFHEDGVNSALAVARDFSVTLESCTAAYTKDTLSTAAMLQ